MTIYATTKSLIKLKAIQNVFMKEFSEEKLVGITISSDDIPEQPVGCDNTKTCAKLRISILKKQIDFREEDLIISIESGLNGNCDIQAIVMQTGDGKIFCETSIQSKFILDNRIVNIIKNFPHESGLGYKQTYGECISKNNSLINPKYWMDFYHGEGSRRAEMERYLDDILIRYTRYSKIKKNILKFPDFPKKGVLFKDMSKILSNPELLKLLKQDIEFALKKIYSFNKVLGIDSRGYIYGMIIVELCKEKGFVIARKKNKTPGKSDSDVLRVEYGTEYSKDTIELMTGLINRGDRVLIVDDLVATGGSLRAAEQLVELSGGTVVGCFCPLKVEELFFEAQNCVKSKIHTLY